MGWEHKVTFAMNDEIDGKSEYFYETMHGKKKHFCLHCWDEHPVEVDMTVQQMGYQYK